MSSHTEPSRRRAVSTGRHLPSRLLALVAALLLAGAVAATPASATSDADANANANADDPPGPRPADPDVECVTGGKDVVELPAPQVRLGADASWILTQGEGVTVAVVDSGVDPWNQQLQGQVEPGVDTVFEGATGNADCLGQGTAVAGLVAALPFEGIGFHGVAPGARIYPVRIVADELDVSSGALATGIDAAVASGAQIVLVTVSSPTRSAALDAAVDAAVSADVLLVAPAVLGADTPDYGYPAAYDEVLAVGAVDEEGAALDEAPASPVVDLVAPGTDVVSLLPGKGHTLALTGAVPAAAYVAGVAALVRSEHPELTAALVRDRLEATADRPGTEPPDPVLGWGMVNVQVALSAVISAETGDAPESPAAVVVRPPRAEPAADRSTEHRAIWVFGIGLGIGVALLIAAAVVPRGRRTSWRPARSSTVLPRRS